MGSKYFAVFVTVLGSLYLTGTNEVIYESEFQKWGAKICDDDSGYRRADVYCENEDPVTPMTGSCTSIGVALLDGSGRTKKYKYNIVVCSHGDIKKACFSAYNDDDFVVHWEYGAMCINPTVIADSDY